MGALNDRSDVGSRICELELRLRATRRWLLVFALSGLVLVVGAWVHEAREVRAERVVIVDPDGGDEGSIRLEEGNLIVENPSGARTVITGEGALILRAGGSDSIRIGGSPARPLR